MVRTLILIYFGGLRIGHMKQIYNINDCRSRDTLKFATLLKKRLSHRFFCEFCEILKNTFFDRTPIVAEDFKFWIKSNIILT